MRMMSARKKTRPADVKNEPVNESENNKLISSLKSISTGYDMIGSAARKCCVECISRPLSGVCDMSIQEGILQKN